MIENDNAENKDRNKENKKSKNRNKIKKKNSPKSSSLGNKKENLR